MCLFGVQGVQLHAHLQLRYKRLARREVLMREQTTYVLSVVQLLLQECNNAELCTRHVESNAPGKLRKQYIL